MSRNMNEDAHRVACRCETEIVALCGLKYTLDMPRDACSASIENLKLGGLVLRDARCSDKFWSTIEAMDKEVKLLRLHRYSRCKNLEDTFDLKKKKKKVKVKIIYNIYILYYIIKLIYNIIYYYI
ncbi:hypothetical protein Scep_024457 [Stephania cephalantha]|uniref:Uncharacterized protein n=1 Tax=Stephania cephalantha TaxID=152367 RepID=A0AAP0F231_9MAGN